MIEFGYRLLSGISDALEGQCEHYKNILEFFQTKAIHTLTASIFRRNIRPTFRTVELISSPFSTTRALYSLYFFRFNFGREKSLVNHKSEVNSYEMLTSLISFTLVISFASLFNSVPNSCAHVSTLKCE